ncbi:MAG: HAD-IIA family hydrolase [Candidatus Korarchaeum sp.]|nr:HAD-IIA family hydrolase [Candidatus Korarchaeum sp.]MDW8035492.1 HAD-IIA family hydrolase [Candidatus Korarchaeum sp.]
MLKPSLKDYDLLILDIDGVVWLDGKPIESSVRAINIIRDQVSVAFVTNNSTRHRRDIVSQMRAIGIPWVSESDVFTSASTLADLSSKLGVRRCYVIGEIGLLTELEEAGLEISDEGDVCVGLDRSFDYRKLSLAVRSLLSGYMFLATNEDRLLPTPSGFIPGAGAIVAAISAACSRKPDVVVGKPNPIMFLQASSRFGAKRPLVIGDVPETDILGAMRSGMDSALLIRDPSSDLRGIKPRPKYVLRSLEELIS